MTVLLIDDDLATVDMVQNNIGWSSLKINKVLRAYTGEAAKPILQQHKPDIVICDIEMPRCTGLELLTWCNENQIKTDFVFLTCHEDFSFAQQAIQLGAIDYITKPILIEVLYKKLQSITEKLLEVRYEQQQYFQHAVTHILHTLFGSSGQYADEASLQQVLDKRKIPLNAQQRYKAIYCGVDYEKLEDDGWGEPIFLYAFRHLTFEMITDELEYPLCVDFHENGRYIFIILIKEDTCSEEDLKKRCEQFIEYCTEHLKYRPSCFISNSLLLHDIPNRNRSYNKLMMQSMYIPGSVLEEKSKTSSDADHLNKVQSIEIESIRQFLLQEDKESFISYLEKKQQPLEGELSVTEEFMQLIHQDLLQVFYSYLEENNIQAHMLFSGEKATVLNRYAERSYSDLIRFANYFFDMMVSQLQLLTYPNEMVREVMSMVQKNFQQPLSRTLIANSVFVTPNYLSRIFRNETGIALREYINNVRIDNAQKMLRSTNSTVSDIAFDCGFENIPYFSTVFKKQTGLSPLEWREKYRNGYKKSEE